MRNEMITLIDMLTSANIPFELRTDACGNKNNQIYYPSYESRTCDVICHEYSYGGREGLLEIMGLVDDEIWITTGTGVSKYFEETGTFNSSKQS